jgi:hypothetical protein
MESVTATIDRLQQQVSDRENLVGELRQKAEQLENIRTQFQAIALPAIDELNDNLVLSSFETISDATDTLSTLGGEKVDRLQMVNEAAMHGQQMLAIINGVGSMATMKDVNDAESAFSDLAKQIEEELENLDPTETVMRLADTVKVLSLYGGEEYGPFGNRLYTLEIGSLSDLERARLASETAALIDELAYLREEMETAVSDVVADAVDTVKLDTFALTNSLRQRMNKLIDEDVDTLIKVLQTSTATNYAYGLRLNALQKEFEATQSQLLGLAARTAEQAIWREFGRSSGGPAHLCDGARKPVRNPIQSAGKHQRRTGHCRRNPSVGHQLNQPH